MSKPPDIQIDINRLMANFSVRVADLTSSLVVAEQKVESCMAMIAERDARISELEGLLEERKAAERRSQIVKDGLDFDKA